MFPYATAAPDAAFHVGIPVHNEAERIGDCLLALKGQVDHAVLLLNNCTDGTDRLVHAAVDRLDYAVTVIECKLPPERANAGWARHLAMSACAEMAGRGAVLLTTDADSRVAPDWAANTRRALAKGAAVVCGRVELDPAEAARIPAALHEDDARECAYDRLLDAIHDALDPDPFDPAPRHTEASGASIAVTAEAFAAVGGVPPRPSGEDRALIAALRAIDAPIRHAPDVRVVTSGRLDGRAPGGMADTIRRRMSAPDLYLDDRLEPALDCVRRAELRRRLRTARPGSHRALASELGLAPEALARVLALPFFGQRWDAVEHAAPNLRKRRVAVSQLSTETEVAEAILHVIRWSGADPGDTPAVAAA